MRCGMPATPSTHAADGEEALTAVKGRAFDLVICDLKMPRLDGQAFYASLVQAVPALASRVIFVTGDVAGTEAEQFLEGSGCRWLAKPFRLADLLKAVREGLSSGLARDGDRGPRDAATTFRAAGRTVAGRFSAGL